MIRKPSSLRIVLPALVCGLVGAPRLASAAAGVEVQVVVVPFAPQDLDLPHPAHERARVTLKAIVRGATCGSGYYIRWDVDQDDDFEDDIRQRIYPTNGAIYDIGRTFEVPYVDGDQTMPINVRVRDRCTGEDVYGTYRMFVYDWEPSNDPREWTQDQVVIMTQMALQESIWWLHRRVGSYGGSGARIRATVLHPKGSTYNVATNAAMIWAMTNNGHLPAYPPGRLDPYSVALPPGWHEINDARWHADPYAETMIRALNYSLYRGTNLVGVSGVDEGNTCGFGPDGTELECPRIPGTTDDRGLYTGGNSGVYVNAKVLGAFATLLPALAGTPLQEGSASVRGKTFEWYIQQLTDYVGYMQIDAGCAVGGWYYYNRSGSQACSQSDASTSQWAYIGLESAEVAGKPYGVIVNNRHKYRIADNLINNQCPDGGSGYRSSYNKSTFQLSGGAFVGARWLGIHQLDANDDSKPFSPYSNFAASSLRRSYDNYLAYTANLWTSRTHYGSIGWVARLWQNGDYLCGNTNAVYNAGRCGNTYAMYSHQKGYRTGMPELLMVGSHDWMREFYIYYMRAQDRSMRNYSRFGRIYDQFCDRSSVTCTRALAELTTGWAALVLTPSVFKPKPVAMAEARPLTVVEGCAGGNSGIVEFHHDESFHPNADARLMAFFWDVDDEDGLWWETGAQPDFVTGDAERLFRHTYEHAGVYRATLRVVDDRVPADDDTDTIDITVEEAPPVPPSVSHGGPYVMDQGEDLKLNGEATDQNEACGEWLMSSWDIDGDGMFNEEVGEADWVPWAALADLPTGVPVEISMGAIDERDLWVVETTTLTIFPIEPVAVPQANPDPAACHQLVLFDGGGELPSEP